MIKRPPGIGVFEFVVLAGLRAGQLARGCVPRVPASDKLAVTAQTEVALGKVGRMPPTVPDADRSPAEPPPAAVVSDSPSSPPPPSVG